MSIIFGFATEFESLYVSNTATTPPQMNDGVCVLRAVEKLAKKASLLARMPGSAPIDELLDHGRAQTIDDDVSAEPRTKIFNLIALMVPSLLLPHLQTGSNRQM
ncbi:hypothetical protein RSAG8_09833, partial [Rhizoctonia solani AG-8 WAC10335]